MLHRLMENVWPIQIGDDQLKECLWRDAKDLKWDSISNFIIEDE